MFIFAIGHLGVAMQRGPHVDLLITSAGIGTPDHFARTNAWVESDVDLIGYIG